MFSLLNKRYQTGKHGARMCKFLVCLPQFFRRLWRRILKASYLIEAVRLRGAKCPPLLGIELPPLPANRSCLEFRSGKD